MADVQDQLDWAMLRHADNERGVLPVVGLTPLPETVQPQLDRAIDRGWLTLVDVTVQGRLFKLTDRGIARLQKLAEQFKEDISK